MQDLKNKKDEELLALARAGDQQAMECLLNRYRNMVRARAREFIFVHRELDDLIQEGMVGLYVAANEYRPECGKSFKNFAYLCVRRRILDFVKQLSRQKNAPLYDYISIYNPDFSLSTDEQSPEESVIDVESRSEFWLKIGKVLSDFEFRIISMYLEGMSYNEMCEATGKPSKSIDNALARSKKKLKSVFIIES